ncbi:MAG: hypothetical protein HN356_06960 [Calditrichaeota bacterium]|nr:hypothetical protein [Calditrichota bacterium]
MLKNLLIVLIILISYTPCESAESTTSDIYIRNFTPDEYHASSQNWAVVQDRRGIMYFGNSDGILEFDGNTWHLITLPDSSGVHCLELDEKGRIYVGGEGEIGFLAPGVEGSMDYISFRDKIPEAFQHSSDEIFSIQFTSEGIVFLADKLMYILHNDRINVIESEDYYFSAVCIDNSLNVIDGAKGLLHLKNGILEPKLESGDFRSYLMLPYINDKIIIVLPDGRIVTHDGKDDQFGLESFSALPELDLGIFMGLEIKSAALLSNNCIAFGTIKNGCFILDSSGEIKYHLKQSNGLVSDNVLALSTDDKGNIWLCSGDGISFINLDCASGFSNQSDRDVSNQDTSGISGRSEAIFTTVIRQIVSTKYDSLIFGGAYYKTVGGVQVLEQADLLLGVFPFDDNAFRISYSSTYYKDIEKIEYQTYLEGLEDDWLKWSNRTRREFTNLYWGDYTFHVRARNANGDISAEATYSFTIKTPWFEAWWFYASQIAFILTLLFISGYLSRYGKAQKLSDSLTNIVVIIIFKYTIVLMGPFLGVFSAGIGFFKVIMNVALAFVLLPSQKFIRKQLKRIVQKELQNTLRKKLKNRELGPGRHKK